MEQYKYEIHVHTSETSKCGKSSGADFVRHFKNMGYTGIFVTDHFLNGNTIVPKDIPWSERIKLFCLGYDTALQEGRKVGLDVFFAWEYSYGWAHFLTYGLNKDWLLAHPDFLLSWDLVEYFDRVHEGGGFIIHAHPFREKVDIVHLAPNHVDAVEVLNAGRSDESNRHALDYANSFGLPHCAGSDIHSINQERRCGMIFPNRLTNAQDLKTAIQSGEVSKVDENIT